MADLFTLERFLGALTTLFVSPLIAVTIVNIWGKRWTETKIELEKHQYQDKLQKEIEKLRFEFQRDLQKEIEATKSIHQKDLELVKNGYQKDLEIHKLELEKSKSKFVRYSEHQFKLYNELWISLYDLKINADKLWEEALVSNLKAFSNQLNKSIEMLEKSILLLEDVHYSKLKYLLDRFSNLKIGKENLINLKEARSNGNDIESYQIENLIQDNRVIVNEYSSLISEIGKVLKEQIKG